MRIKWLHNTDYGFVFMLLAAALCAVGLFAFVYRCDNKYTAPRPDIQNGSAMLDGPALSQGKLAFLIEGWELYRGILLAPEDFTAGDLPVHETVFIGQYGGFDTPDNPNPHGLATYRLTLVLPQAEAGYTLELPEIFSAYKLYINGALVKQIGELDSGAYTPETLCNSVSFNGAGNVELIFQTANYSHIYSGLAYPPAFGTSDTVAKYLNTRLLLHMGAISIAGLVGAVFLCAGLFMLRSASKSVYSELFLYGLLCLSFAATISYPIAKLFISGMWYYLAENLCYCAMLLLVVLIQQRVMAANRKLTVPVVVFGLLMCAASLLAPFCWQGNLPLILKYSNMIGIYKYITAAFLAVNAGIGMKRGKKNGLIVMAGHTVFGTALVMDRIYPMFEPIYTGWFAETGCAALIMCIGAATLCDVVLNYKKSRQTRENERRLAVENAALDRLSRMKTEMIATVTHETITPLAVLSGYAELIAMELRRGGAWMNRPPKTLIISRRKRSVSRR